MIMFNIIFGLAILASIRVIVRDLSYLILIKRAAAAATIPSVHQALSTNKHFLSSCRKAVVEFNATLHTWLPLTLIALIALSLAWVQGYNNTWTLTEPTTLWLALLVTPVYARPWTHPVDINWLLQWSAGVKATLVACQYTEVVERIAELDQIISIQDKPNNALLVEREHLHQMKMQMEIVIGTLPGSRQSGSLGQ